MAHGADPFPIEKPEAYLQPRQVPLLLWRQGARRSHGLRGDRRVHDHPRHRHAEQLN